MQGGRGLAHEAPVPLVNSAMPSTVWLGLSRAGSMLSSAWDGVSELFERGKNWVQGEGFRTGKEIAVDAALAAFHEMGVKEAIQSALQEFGTQQAQEVLKSFYNDSKEVTEAKVWALKEAGYDTTKLEAAIAKRRQAIEEKQLAQHKDEKARKLLVKEGGVWTSIKVLVEKTLFAIGWGNGYYVDIDDNTDGKDWVKFEKDGKGFNDNCREGQQDHKYVTKEFAEIVSEAINDFHEKTGETVYVNDFSPKPGEKSEFGHHDREYDRGYVVDVKWVAKDDKIYSGDYDKYKNIYDRENTIKLIESFIENANEYLTKKNLKMIFYYNDMVVIENIRKRYSNINNKYLYIKDLTGHSNHIHIGIYKKQNEK